MCEKSKCRRRTEDLCSCPPVKNREDNLFALLEHMAVNMTDIRWELDYTDLNRPEKRRLCRVGTCRVCGGVLCHEMDASDHLAGDGFLAAAYRHLYQVHHARGRDMTDAEFRRRFVEMFHDQDRPVVRGRKTAMCGTCTAAARTQQVRENRSWRSRSIPSSGRGRTLTGGFSPALKQRAVSFPGGGPGRS